MVSSLKVVYCDLALALTWYDLDLAQSNPVFCSYILKVPFDTEDNQGIVYVWIGNRANPEEARLTEDIAEEMYEVGDTMWCNLCYSRIVVLPRRH